jgi:biotin operon repressor
MGLLNYIKDTLKDDLGLSKKPAKEFRSITTREIIRIDGNRIDLQTPRKHPNYYKVKDIVMRSVICNIDTMLSCREIANILGIGKSSVNRQIQVLQEEGFIRKVILGNSNRSIYYKIMINKADAILYRDMFTPSGNKKKIKI